ncbi:MAG TPA: hypothetical protein VJ861_05635 [Treponemataceae bacterium]|nr:hypothetical protein [Treponemataceae bacterium]
MSHNETEKKKLDARSIAGLILSVTLLLSMVYAIVHLIIAPSAIGNLDAHTRLKSDYFVMLLQCIIGLIVMLIPSMIEKKLSFSLPNYMSILYFVFLYCAIFLGEIRNFYYVIPHWDTILHAFSGAMLGALGFSLVSVLNDIKKIKLKLSPIFIALFAFCFALAVGAIWEIYEFAADTLFGFNMQRFAAEDGTLFIGQAALADTMKDIIADALSAFIISVIGFFTIKKDRLASKFQQDH